MKFIHTADWHLGKLVHGIYMTGQQRHVLEQFIALVAEEAPDAVVIAGDLYDRSVPPTEAVALLEDVFYRINIELKTPILAISGNHDSAERLSFGSSWYRNSGLYINGRIQDCFEPVRIGGVDFYLVPYAEPGLVRDFFDDGSVHCHESAMKRVTGKIEECLDPSVPSVMVGHAFVLGGATSESERTLSAGNAGCVGAGCFSPFAYTALGHLHSPDAIKHETIRYSGSLLKYSFSEVNHTKSVSIVTVEEGGGYSLETRELVPDQDMRELSGTLERLLDPQFYGNEKTDDFLKVTLLDEGALIDPIGKLRAVYPNVLHLERKIETADRRKKQSYQSGSREKKDELELFGDFYGEMTTSTYTDEKREMMAKVIDLVKKELQPL